MSDEKIEMLLTASGMSLLKAFLKICFRIDFSITSWCLYGHTYLDIYFIQNGIMQLDSLLLAWHDVGCFSQVKLALKGGIFAASQENQNVLYGCKAVAKQKFCLCVTDINAQTVKQKTLPRIYKVCQLFFKIQSCLYFVPWCFACSCFCHGCASGLSCKGLWFQ